MQYCERLRLEDKKCGMGTALWRDDFKEENITTWQGSCFMNFCYLLPFDFFFCVCVSLSQFCGQFYYKLLKK